MSKAHKLLERMRATKKGWGHDDLDSLYRGFGFVCKEGGNHTIYKHPRHPELRATVARHRTLAVGYIQEALALIERLQEMEKDNET